MPIKVVVYKWLCRVCQKVYDTEADCVEHEADRHKELEAPDALVTLEDVYKRMDESENDYDRLVKYEHICQMILLKARRIKKCRVDACSYFSEEPDATQIPPPTLQILPTTFAPKLTAAPSIIVSFCWHIYLLHF
jgi:hypothetical protein